MVLRSGCDGVEILSGCDTVVIDLIVNNIVNNIVVIIIIHFFLTESNESLQGALQSIKEMEVKQRKEKELDEDIESMKKRQKGTITPDCCICLSEGQEPVFDPCGHQCGCLTL
jgi:mannitol-specific phosphotransferase system IIBC component